MYMYIYLYVRVYFFKYMYINSWTADFSCMRAYENATGERISVVKVADGMTMTLDRSAVQIHNFYINRTMKVALASLNFSPYSTSRFLVSLAQNICTVVDATVEDIATTCACIHTRTCACQLLVHQPHPQASARSGFVIYHPLYWFKSTNADAQLVQQSHDIKVVSVPEGGDSRNLNQERTITGWQKKKH